MLVFFQRTTDFVFRETITDTGYPVSGHTRYPAVYSISSRIFDNLSYITKHILYPAFILAGYPVKSVSGTSSFLHQDNASPRIKDLHPPTPGNKRGRKPAGREISNIAVLQSRCKITVKFSYENFFPVIYQ